MGSEPDDVSFKENFDASEVPVELAIETFGTLANTADNLFDTLDPSLDPRNWFQSVPAAVASRQDCCWMNQRVPIRRSAYV